MNSQFLSKLFGLEGQVVLITGSARGIGWGIANVVAEAGAHVILNDIDRALLEKQKHDMLSRGLKCSIAPFDVTQEDQVERGIAESVAELGPIDVLVNNAGIQNRKPFLELMPTEWQKLIDVHLHGSYLTTRAVAPHMVAQRHGRIIMIGSITTQSVKVTATPYVAAKGALTALSRALAFELGPKGVTCNTISPGFTATELTQSIQDDPAFSKFIAERVPLQRWGTPEDLGPAVVYLASKAGSFLNGANLVIDGGVLAAM